MGTIFSKISIVVELSMSYNGMWKKLPYDLENEGKFMVYKVAYLVKAYDIPLILVMNNDQIGMVLFKYYVCVNHEYE